MKEKIKFFIILLIFLVVKQTDSTKNKEKTEKEKIHQPWDKIQKEHSIKFINWIFKYYGIDEEIISEKNSELTTLKGGKQNADFVGKSKYGHDVNVEFQTNKPQKKDLKRFRKYAHEIDEKYDLGVETYVLSVEKCPKKEYCLKYGSKNRFHVRMINFEDMETTKILNTIESKIQTNKKLNEEDLLFLKVGFITLKEIDTFELLLKLTKITNNIKELPKSEIDEIKFAHGTFANHLLTDEEYKKIMEEIRMNYPNILTERYETGEKNGFKNGFEKGEENRKKIVAKKLLKTGMNIEDISEISELPLETIKQLKTN